MSTLTSSRSTAYRLQRLRLLALLAVALLPWASSVRGAVREPSVTPAAVPQAVSPALSGPPMVKWAKKGWCESWGCETGWYSSPAVADLNGDGHMEVIGASYQVVVVDGATGTTVWSVDSGREVSNQNAGSVGRSWPGVIVADVDNSGGLEIVTAHGGGVVSVYNANGAFKAGWPKKPVSSELRGLAAYDLDGDDDLEIVVNAAQSGSVNTWVYEHTGALRTGTPGWPQLNNDSGYAAGVYNQNTALGDIDADGVGEIIVPSDVHYINAYEPRGSQIPASSIYGGKGWGKVGVWENINVELRGWGECGGVRAERYRTNFAGGPAVIADVDGDGTTEVVVTGNVYDCAYGHPPGKYTGVYIFKADRSRWRNALYSWRTVPVDTGAPLTENYGVIENAQSNPVVVDLNSDGLKEILFPSYDGRVHAFRLDKREFGGWPYRVYRPEEGVYRFATEPAVVDIGADGLAEVIFASWAQKGKARTGKLHILNHRGVPLYEVPLPRVPSGQSWNGALAAPTVANIDADADLEVVLATAYSGLVAYDLPGSAGAAVLWGTGRGNYQRSGSLLAGSLQPSRLSVSDATPTPGQTISYTLTLRNPGPLQVSGLVTSTLPAELSFAGNLVASGGSAQETGGVISWSGTVGAAQAVVLTFDVTVRPEVVGPRTITLSAFVDDRAGTVWRRSAVATVGE